MRLSRPTSGSVPLVALVTLYLLFATNGTFWRKAITYFGGHPVHLAALAAGLFLLFFAILTALSLKYLVKPVLITLILVSASASYFVDTYGFLIDRETIANVVLTSSAEAGRLLTPSLVIHFVLFALVPAALVMLVRVRHRSFWAKARWNSAAIFPSLLGAGAIALVFYPSYASTFRTHRDLAASFNPVAPLVAGYKFADGELGTRSYALAPLGTDAVPGSRLAAGTRPVVTILVVGETARSQEFALNGYERDTTPGLARRGVVSFTHVSSCGTSTAVSVPCMFSNLTRANYSRAAARSVENVLDVLGHAGIERRWIDNDSGAYHVADRIPYSFLPETNDPRFCRDGECRDDILTERLREELKTVTRDTVIVLHQIGSHGPTYFEATPKGSSASRPPAERRSSPIADVTRSSEPTTTRSFTPTTSWPRLSTSWRRGAISTRPCSSSQTMGNPLEKTASTFTPCPICSPR